jgi:uncharacterized protein
VIGVDTNIVVYASDEFAPEHAVCRRLLLGVPASPDMPAEPLCIPWSVIYEFLRVVTHPRAMRRPWSMAEAWAFVTVLLRSPHITVLGPGPGHAAAAERMLSAPGVRGNLVHDATRTSAGSPALRSWILWPDSPRRASQPLCHRSGQQSAGSMTQGGGTQWRGVAAGLSNVAETAAWSLQRSA